MPRPSVWALAEWWLRHRLPAHTAETCVGDLFEDYEARRATHGRAASARWLLGEARSLSRSFAHAQRQVRPPRPSIGERMKTILQDLKYAVRSLRRARGFAAVVVLTLALGIGANAAIFSIVNAIVLRPLSYPQSDQLVRITSELKNLAAPDTGVSPPELFDYQSHTDLFSGVAGLYPINANITGGAEPERAEVMLVSWNYFSILGGVPALGRVFGPGDDGPGIPERAVVSDGYWRRRLGADRSALGRTINVDGDPFVIVGVMPPEFHHPGRTVESGDVDIWSPAGYRAMPFGPPVRGRRFLEGALARLQPGVTLAQAQAQLDAYGATATRDYPADYPERNGWHPRIVPLQTDVVGAVTSPMLMLLSAVGLVLLIVCANIAHLVLVRASERQQEMAIRQALGASATRLTQQLLTESAVLAVVGGALGLFVASWGVQALVALAPSRVPRLSEVSIDGAAMTVTAVLAMLMTVLFGLVPAWQMRRLNTFALVKEGGGGRSSSPERARRRGVLVSAEVALAMVLLVGAGLLIRSVGALMNVPRGFDASNVVTARVWLPRPNDSAQAVYLDPARRVAFYREVLRRVRALPGVEVAAMSTQIPLGGYNAPAFFEAEGRNFAEQDVRPVIQNFQVSADYFDAMKIPVVRGRAFTDGDQAGGEPVAIINASEARTIWGDENPLGKRVRFNPQAPWMTIVGVVGDVRNRRLDEAPPPILYRSLEQSSNLSLSLLVRTAADVTGLGQAITREVRAVDPELPVYAVRTMDDLLAGAVAGRQFFMRILAAFGVAAIGLALLGIYGVMSYSVTQRTREIGIRMAIGARASDVSQMVVRQGLVPAAAGIAAGVAGALGLSQLLASQLFGVQPFDPLTLVSVIAVMGCVTAVAAYVPARRAARVNPIIALRGD
jgi:putative ABC transport system permease protein